VLRSGKWRKHRREPEKATKGTNSRRGDFTDSARTPVGKKRQKNNSAMAKKKRVDEDDNQAGREYWKPKTKEPQTRALPAKSRNSNGQES